MSELDEMKMLKKKIKVNIRLMVGDDMRGSDIILLVMM